MQDVFPERLRPNGQTLLSSRRRWRNRVPLRRRVLGRAHYNYFRDYDPTTGRYDESDPLGLRGGVSTYAYAGGNPVSLVDPRGLLTADEAYQHYLGGTGTPMRMAFADIDTSGVKPSSFAAVQAAVTGAKQTKKEGCCTPSTTPIDDRQPFTTGGSNFLLLGNITLRLQGTFVVRTDCTWIFDGTLKSFDDRYDFNASTVHRPGQPRREQHI